MPGEIWAQIEADAKNTIMHQTWGHLFPDADHYEGNVRIINQLYSLGNHVLDESEGLPNSSPWWFNAIQDFAFEVMQDMKTGEVSEFKIIVNIVACEEDLEQWQKDEDWEPKQWQEIHITASSKLILVKGF